MVVKSSPLSISLALCHGHLFANNHFSESTHVRIQHHHHILTKARKEPEGFVTKPRVGPVSVTSQRVEQSLKYPPVEHIYIPIGLRV